MKRAEDAQGSARLQQKQAARKKHKRKRQRRRGARRWQKGKKIGAKSATKWLRASRRRRVRKKMPSRLREEQSGKRLSKIGTARKSETRKRRKTGKRRTKWMAVQWDEERKLEEILGRRRMEGWKETPYSWKSCKRYEN